MGSRHSLTTTTATGATSPSARSHPIAYEFGGGVIVMIWVYLLSLALLAAAS